MAGEGALVVICQAILARCHFAVEVVALNAAITFAATILNVAETNTVTTTSSFIS